MFIIASYSHWQTCCSNKAQARGWTSHLSVDVLPNQMEVRVLLPSVIGWSGAPAACTVTIPECRVLSSLVFCPVVGWVVNCPFKGTPLPQHSHVSIPRNTNIWHAFKNVKACLFCFKVKHKGKGTLYSSHHRRVRHHREELSRCNMIGLGVATNGKCWAGVIWAGRRSIRPSVTSPGPQRFDSSQETAQKSLGDYVVRCVHAWNALARKG